MLMESVLAMIPEEERVKYSAMTGQSLYYLVETNLKNKVLGRSLDELPPQTRRLLEHLKEMVGARCEFEEIDPELCWFTRREVREFTGWSNTQLKVHLDRLEELEYIYPRRAGMRGSAYEYELLFDGDTDTAKPQLIGLIDLEKLGYDKKFTGAMAEFAGPKRPQNGAFTGSSFMSAVARKNASTAPKGSKKAKAEAAQASEKAASRRKRV